MKTIIKGGSNMNKQQVVHPGEILKELTHKNSRELNEAFMGDVEIIKQILAEFQKTVVNFEKDFRALERVGDKERLSMLVHSLKGSSANIRSETVSKQAALVQNLIDQGQAYAPQFDVLISVLSKLKNEIKSKY